MKRQQIKAFTLVELIIVITILAILATIGFMSYQSYTSDARDANRITTLKQISNWLDITYTKKASYPMPDWTINTGSINWIVYSYKWTIWDSVSKTLRMDKTTDPSSKEEYIYWINTDKTQYQIAAVLENNVVANIWNIAETTYADLGLIAKVSGNYPGYIKFSSWSENWIANIPSLLWNNTWSVNLLATATQYVVNKKTNLPYKLSSSTDLGSKDANTIIKEITWTWVASLTSVNITNIKTSSDVVNNFTWVLLASFWWNIDIVTKKVLANSSISVAIETPITPFIPSEHFSVITYAWDWWTQNIITWLDMSSWNNWWLVWIKNRNSVTQHSITDTVRWAWLRIVSNSTSVENWIWWGNVTTFNNNWFRPEWTVETWQSWQNYVAWSWRTTDKTSWVTNHWKRYTAHYNARSWFSMVWYKWSWLSEHQIPHFLGNQPELVFVKSRDQNYWWIVHSKYIWTFWADYLFLEQNIWLQMAWLHIWYDWINIMQKDWSQNRNQLDKSYIAYAFTSVPWFSKIWTYPWTWVWWNRIDVWFEPAFLMVKRIDSTWNWTILDNKRWNSNEIAVNLPNAEYWYYGVDITTTWFNITWTGPDWNTAWWTYLYYAISK